MSNPEKNASSLDRRSFLKQSTRLGIGCALVTTIPACSLFDEPEMLVCQLSELDRVSFVTQKFNRKRILARKMDGEITIFSLICSHKRCTVKYKEMDEQFACPCHEGLYDKYGQVIDGPPPEALSRFQFEIRGEELWVLNEFQK